MADEYKGRDLSSECAFCPTPNTPITVFEFTVQHVAVCRACQESLIFEKLVAQGRWPVVRG